MLTRKQHDLLMFIHERLSKSSVSPSFEEMKAALDLKSKSGVHRLITALEERGFVKRLPHRARALAVVKLPDAALPQGLRARTVRTGDAAAAPTGDQAPAIFTPRPANDVVSLPLYGRIAAGTPIEALADRSTFIDVPANIVGSKQCYALEIAGDSMIDAGIWDKDTVIIERAETADNGQIVVALVDDQEATLKRIRRKGNSIALEAANPAYETRIFGPDRVKVQGKLIGLFRKY
jgi:repressor LexA